jgi:hypothetical protein
MLVNCALVHAATMHIDAKVLRVDSDTWGFGEGHRERRSASAFPSRGAAPCVPCDAGCASSISVGAGDGASDTSGGDMVVVITSRRSTCLTGGRTEVDRPWCKVVHSCCDSYISGTVRISDVGRRWSPATPKCQNADDKHKPCLQANEVL